MKTTLDPTRFSPFFRCRTGKVKVDVGVVETALLRAAASVVTKAGKLWLGRRREHRERATPLVELIGAGVTDDLRLRRAARRRDDIVDIVCERLRAAATAGPPPRRWAARQ
jgi:hypothetical protein